MGMVGAHSPSSPPCTKNPVSLNRAQQRCHRPSRARARALTVRAVFDEMEAFTNLMTPGAASVVTAMIAATSVSLNLYGGLLTERKRADLAKQRQLPLQRPGGRPLAGLPGG
ncbi:hypothetical protein TSOC_011706 [Tetrabaena socialis]|uniref:Uncharacterized protein n=1 Tax=Tetrabaena socialis TaxID=47790 RepID=A0A2J7ZPY1_9CHLO|nr:hypothetical protein TSOC_011706 [Tetrabaena socialis]|eukprot:PNH02325.1 hypothetical protein TSOC_011706 [Tetrabaena socialis]